MNYEAQLRQQYQAVRERLGIRHVPVRRHLRLVPSPSFHAPVTAEADAEVEWEEPKIVGAPFGFYRFPSWKNVVQFVALKHGITFEDILGHDKCKAFVKARHEAVVMVESHCQHMSITNLGRRMNLDHTTVLYILRKHRAVTSVDKKTAIVISRVNEDSVSAATGDDFQSKPSRCAETGYALQGGPPLTTQA